MKRTATLLMGFLLLGSLAISTLANTPRLLADDELVQCDIDANALQTRTECLEAPILVNLRDNIVMNTQLTEKIDAFIITQSKLVAFWWTLDPKKHDAAANKTFFEKVNRIPDFDLEVPAKSLEKGEYNLILYAINEKHKLSFKKFLVTMNDPQIWLTLAVAPASGESINTEFTFSFTKKGEEEIYYVLSYVRGDRLITIDSALASKEMNPVKYHFPMFMQATQELDLVLDYYTGSNERHSIFGKVTVTKPSLGISDLEKKLDEIEKKGDKDINLKYTVAIVASLSSMNFKYEGHHTEDHFVRCSELHCNSNGQCIMTSSGWKQCNCATGFEGPTCGFAKGKEKDAIHLMKRVSAILDRAQLDASNIGQMTEIIKIQASSVHMFSWEVIDATLVNINRAIKSLGDAVIVREVIEDIFIAIENINVALMQNYWLKAEAKEGGDDLGPKTFNKIQEARGQADLIFSEILGKVKNHEFFNHPMEKAGLTLVTSTPSRLTQGWEQVILQSEMGKRNQARVETVVSVNRDLMSQFKGGNHPVGIILYQTFYNPFEIVTGDKYIPVSHSVTVRLRDPQTKTDLSLTTKPSTVQVILKADKEKVSNLKDLDCGRFNPKYKVFTLAGCTTKLHSELQVECLCDGPGEYVLLVKNPQPSNPKEEPTTPENREGSGSSMELSQVILTMLIVTGVWGATYVAGLREGLPNPPFSEGFTAHPIYSILMVYTSDTPRSVRVHLFFITIITQLTAVSYLYENKAMEGITLALLAIAASIPINYIFGLIARAIAGGSKQQSKGIFIIIAEAIILSALIASDMKLIDLANTEEEVVSKLIKVFLMSLVIDVVVLDTIVSILTKVPFIKNVVALRGFFTSMSDRGERTEYLRQADVPL